MKFRIKFSGALIAFAVFLLLGGYRFMDVEIISSYLAAATLHEIGHIVAAKVCRARIAGITFDVMGARMHLCGAILSYRDEAVIAFFGPAVNFISAAFFFRAFPLFSEFSVMLGTFNMLPVTSFDGYRILYSLVALRSGANTADKVSRLFSMIFVVLLWLFATYVLLRYRSGFTLFIFSCLLFFRLYA